jgi:hypothetical protein
MNGCFELSALCAWEKYIKDFPLLFSAFFLLGKHCRCGLHSLTLLEHFRSPRNFIFILVAHSNIVKREKKSFIYISWTRNDEPTVVNQDADGATSEPGKTLRN